MARRRHKGGKKGHKGLAAHMAGLKKTRKSAHRGKKHHGKRGKKG